jgi:hypothetical protein
MQKWRPGQLDRFVGWLVSCGGQSVGGWATDKTRLTGANGRAEDPFPTQLVRLLPLLPQRNESRPWSTSQMRLLAPTGSRAVYFKPATTRPRLR